MKNLAPHISVRVCKVIAVGLMIFFSTAKAYSEQVSRALCIGVSSPSRRERLPKIMSLDRSAKSIAQSFSLFPQMRKVRLLTSAGSAEGKATTKHIIASTTQLASEGEPRSFLFVFITGHIKARPTDNKQCLVTTDGLLPLDTITSILSTNGKSDVILLIDGCRNEASPLTGSQLFAKMNQDVRQRRWAVLFSAQPGRSVNFPEEAPSTFVRTTKEATQTTVNDSRTPYFLTVSNYLERIANACNGIFSEESGGGYRIFPEFCVDGGEFANTNIGYVQVAPDSPAYDHVFFSALRALGRRETKDVIVQIETWRRSNPLTVEMLYLNMFALMKLERYGEAVHLYTSNARDLKGQYEKYPLILFAYARAYEQQQLKLGKKADPEWKGKTRQYFRDAVRAAHGSVSGLANQVRAEEYLSSDPDVVFNQYEDALRKFPRSSLLHYNYACYIDSIYDHFATINERKAAGKLLAKAHQHFVKSVNGDDHSYLGIYRATFAEFLKNRSEMLSQMSVLPYKTWRDLAEEAAETNMFDRSLRGVIYTKYLTVMTEDFSKALIKTIQWTNQANENSAIDTGDWQFILRCYYRFSVASEDQLNDAFQLDKPYESRDSICATYVAAAASIRQIVTAAIIKKVPFPQNSVSTGAQQPTNWKELGLATILQSSKVVKAAYRPGERASEALKGQPSWKDLVAYSGTLEQAAKYGNDAAWIFLVDGQLDRAKKAELKFEGEGGSRDEKFWNSVEANTF